MMILGIGIDLLEIARIDHVGMDRLARRILTEREQEELASSSHRKREMLAGRFVAKEAISKALGCGIGKVFSFQDAQITYDLNGKPQVELSSGVIRRVYPSSKHISVHLSITHTKGLANAVAVIEEI